jgi:CheY-like chemotaxis protein
MGGHGLNALDLRVSGIWPFLNSWFVPTLTVRGRLTRSFRVPLHNKPQEPFGVLIVEDDPFTRNALANILADVGYEPVPAATVAEGLKKLGGQVCAILDLNLPDGFGTAILERIRSEGRPIRVAVASGTTDGPLLAEAKRLNPDLLIKKPYDLNVVLRWLEEAVASARAGATT